MQVANVPAEIVFLDDFGQIGQDLWSGRDRRTRPWLEAVAKRVKIAIRADARIAVGQPGAAKAPLRFENDEARAGELRLQVVGAANSGNAGPDDKDVEMLRSLRRRRCGAGFCQNVHGPVLF